MKYIYTLFVLFILTLLQGLSGNVLAGQKKTPTQSTSSSVNLHLMVPEYTTPYKVLNPVEIKDDLNRIFHFIDLNTLPQIKEGKMQPTPFSLVSYEWGVTYAGMLNTMQATGDSIYLNYVKSRFKFLSEIEPKARASMYAQGIMDPQLQQMLTPHALDDAGSMCASMIKMQCMKPSFDLTPIINNYMNYIMYKEYRLSDGTFARNRPQKNTLWLDDLYMSVPALAQMGKLTQNLKYFSEATKQLKQFSSRMFVPQKGLYMHGWVEEMQDHPAFFWARANGWAMLAYTEALDVLPLNHPDRDYLLNQLRLHIKGVAAYQSGNGFWHQLIDRDDSYEETSATALFVYCIAHAINKGWIDPLAYGPVAQLGWNAVATKINSEGQVEGTCVGTGMAFDAAFYYHRPVNVYAAHGYGPVLLAGSEMIKLLDHYYPCLNDNALHYYSKPQNRKAAIFSIDDSSRPDAIAAGSTRKGKKPVVFLIGDSTVKNGTGKGDGGLWGWGSFFDEYFDTTKISIENHALGGRSSRSFYTEGLWDKVLPGIQAGDYVFINFGHNDGGSMNTGRARASIKGIGEESQVVIMERNGAPEEVFSYGHYLRIYIRQAKALGAIPIVLSPTPGNRWTTGTINQMNDTYALWAKQVAREEGVQFIDLNALSAKKYNEMGEEQGRTYHGDTVHTLKNGAILNCESIISALKDMKNFSLDQYLK